MSQAAPTAVPSDVLDLFAQQAASTVYEAAGRTGALASHMRPLHPGTRLFGRALTVRCQPGDNLTLHAAVAAAPFWPGRPTGSGLAPSSGRWKRGRR